MEMKRKQRQIRVLLKLVAADGKIERSKHTTLYLGDDETVSLERAVEVVTSAILHWRGEA